MAKYVSYIEAVFRFLEYLTQRSNQNTRSVRFYLVNWRGVNSAGLLMNLNTKLVSY
jgi:hypothetical protein